MKKALLAVIVSIALAGAACAAPEIHVEEPIYNFGSILEGFAVTHVFTLQNTGDEVLQIEGVSASCGCTTTTLATNRLAPGESVDLEVRVDTSGFSGTISKSIYVYVNDPGYADSSTSDRPRFTLRVTGTVVRAQPYHITLSDMNYLFFLLIDLREPEAHAEAHLIGAANIPAAELEGWLDRLPTDALIVLYDQNGEIAEQAAADLGARGYRTAYYALGGLDEWTRWYGTFLLQTGSDAFAAAAREGRDRLACLADDRRCTSVAELRYLAYILIDLRQPEAYAASHLFGAINIPYAEISGRLGELPNDVLAVVYDQANEQSDAVALMMQNAGFAEARSLLGGLNEWVRQFGARFVVPTE